MTDYAKCFDAAVDAIDKTILFPTQLIPGVWNLNTKGMVPAIIIGVIIADALSVACRDCGIPFDFAMARYERLMTGEAIDIKGSPDQIARTQLLKAAALVRLHAHQSGEVAQIGLEDAAEIALKYLAKLPSATAFAETLRVAIETSRKTHD